MLAYLLSSTRQRFADFRLSDKTYAQVKSPCKWQYHSNIIIVNFVKDASVDFFSLQKAI